MLKVVLPTLTSRFAMCVSRYDPPGYAKIHSPVASVVTTRTAGKTRASARPLMSALNPSCGRWADTRLVSRMNPTAC